MRTQNQAGLCDQDTLGAITRSINAGDADPLAAIDLALETYARDPRLHFLKGSLLAAQGRYADARLSIADAVKIAPEFSIARFQLGLLELTSGDAAAALATWRPLHSLPADNPLRLFARGLEHLARDEFQQAIDVLEKGIDLNTDNAPLNADMRMVIDNIMQAMAAKPEDAEPISAAHLLLRQYNSTSKH